LVGCIAQPLKLGREKTIDANVRDLGIEPAAEGSLALLPNQRKCARIGFRK
jgi:hypothetical protein